MDKQKTVYITSPYFWDNEKNARFTQAACLAALDEGSLPVAPQLYLQQILSEYSPAKAPSGLESELALAEVCDEVWVCGDIVTEDMTSIVEHARDLDIPIHYLSRKAIENTMEKYRLLALGDTLLDGHSITDKGYGNSGGHVMIGTLQVHLPVAGRDVWLNFGKLDNLVSITSCDYFWGETEDADWNEVFLGEISLENSESLNGVWAPVAKELVAFCIENEFEATGNVEEIPAGWVPDKYFSKVEDQEKHRLVTSNALIDISGDNVYDMTPQTESSASSELAGP